MKSSNHIETTPHAITHSALLPVVHVESLERVGWYEPGVMAIRLPALPPEPETTGAGLYTDLQTAQALAEQMRQLITIYRLLYGEFYARPQPCN